MPMFDSMLPLGLYVHFPWCVSKCPYCDFNSHGLREGQVLPESDYINALIADLEQSSAAVPHKKLHSIFLGGGTPSLFSAEALHRFFEAVRRSFHWDAEIEVTLEANPGTVEASRFVEYRAIGMNRLSLGIQSFDDDALKRLGRIHDAKSALSAVEAAQQAGFENFNIDLMFGLPSQQVEQGIADLTRAIACGAPHISWYQLTLEPNTWFYRYPPKLPEDELIWALQTEGKQHLEDVGFAQYEVSAYARGKQHQSQHNRNYWEFGDYLGIGAGAHGKITYPQKREVWRYVKHRHPKEYLAGLQNRQFFSEEKAVPPQERAFEFMLNALRLYQKTSLDLFEQRTGLSRSTLTLSLERLRRKALLNFSEKDIELTDLGRTHLNELLSVFLPD